MLVVICGSLYFIRVAQDPPGYYVDESSISFNAHTISQSGMDEFGNAWPLYFRAFGDYKNPVYLYLLAALYWCTGPSALVARLFSAVAILVAAVLLGLLAYRINRSRITAFATTAAALLTPWLFELGHIVLEVALYPAAIALFLVCVHRISSKPAWMRRDVVCLSLTLALVTYTYSIGRLLGPLFAVGLAVFWTRARWPGVVRVWCAYGVTLIPLIIFSDRHPGALTSRFKAVTYLDSHSGWLTMAVQFAQHYAHNLSPWRLLVVGDPNRDQITHLYGTPHFLAGVLGFSLVGLWLAIRAARDEAWWRFALCAFATAIVPASLTNERFHMLRLAAMPVFLLLFAALGFDWFIARINAAWSRRLVAVLSFATIAQAAAFQRQFHVSSQTPRRLHLFDAEYHDRIFAPAIASGRTPLYLADALAIPGYIQAYWYATLARVELARFRLLRAEESPPTDALVITTEENCPRCEVLAHVKPYTLYVAQGPPRAREPLPEEGFRAKLTILEPPQKLRAHHRAEFHVEVTNTSPVTWLARERGAGPLQVSLGNHWLDPDGHTVVSDDARAALLEDLPPGATTLLRLRVNTPRRPGDYLLEIDMLQESVSWFGPKGSPTQKLRVRVE